MAFKKQNNVFCKAVGCTQTHKKHYCRNCKSTDSNHLSKNCIVFKIQPILQKSCKVIGCFQIHDQHFCKSCGDKDSNHFSKDCTQKCKAVGCTQAHKKHHCKVCLENDSNHLASKCPYGITIYHGTKYQAALSIKRTGFNQGKGGRIGAGVYFTDSWDSAQKIAKHRSGNVQAGVLQCRILSTTPTGIHPPWKGVTLNEFREFVVENSKRYTIKIIDIHKVA